MVVVVTEQRVWVREGVVRERIRQQKRELRWADNVKAGWGETQMERRKLWGKWGRKGNGPYRNITCWLLKKGPFGMCMRCFLLCYSLLLTCLLWPAGGERGHRQLQIHCWTQQAGSITSRQPVQPDGGAGFGPTWHKVSHEMCWVPVLHRARCCPCYTWELRALCQNNTYFCGGQLEWG